MDFIDWSQVVWAQVITYSVLVLIAAFIGNLINVIFNGNPITGAILSAFLFGMIFIGWKHYPHGLNGMFGSYVESVDTTSN